MTRPRGRLRERLYASRHGYFWLPCDVCGQHFGGHERGGGTILHDWQRSSITCPRCPGNWIKRGERYVQLAVVLNVDGMPQIMEVYGSSEWPESVNV